MSGRCVDKMKEPQLSLFLDNIHAEILQFVNSIRLYSLQRLWHLLPHLCRSFFPELIWVLFTVIFFLLNCIWSAGETYWKMIRTESAEKEMECEGGERVEDDKNLISTLRELQKTRMINWCPWPEVPVFESVGGSVCRYFSTYPRLCLGESQNQRC